MASAPARTLASAPGVAVAVPVAVSRARAAILALAPVLVPALVLASGCGAGRGPSSPPPPPPADGDPGPSVPSAGTLFVGNEVPVAPAVAGHLRAIAAAVPSRNDLVFMKVGDSMTVNCNAFCCLSSRAGAKVDLDSHSELQPTMAYFNRAALADGSRSWDRVSLAAKIGVNTSWPLDAAEGTPLVAELRATNARFAVIMLGTNDIAGSTIATWYSARLLRAAAHNLFAIVDALTAAGVVSILTYVPPVMTEPEREWITPAYDSIVRGVATAEEIPAIDFYTDVAAIGAGALSSDHVHPLAAPAGACVLNPAGLRYGYNIRNLRTLEVLDKVRAVVIDTTGAADTKTGGPVAMGTGSIADPVTVDALPFAARINLQAGDDIVSDYSACGNYRGATGPEHAFVLTVSEPTPVRAIVVPPTGNCAASTGDPGACDQSKDVNVTLFRGAVDSAHCIASHSTLVERTLVPGVKYWVVVDSFPDAQPDFAVLTVDRCHPTDTACQLR